MSLMKYILQEKKLFGHLLLDLDIPRPPKMF